MTNEASVFFALLTVHIVESVSGKWVCAISGGVLLVLVQRIQLFGWSQVAVWGVGVRALVKATGICSLRNAEKGYLKRKTIFLSLSTADQQHLLLSRLIWRRMGDGPIL